MTDTTQITLGLLFSCAGLGYLMYGRRQKHKPAFYCGIALMVYPYFVSSVAAMALIGLTLMLLPRLIRLR